MATGPRFYLPKAQALDSLGIAVPGGLLNFYVTTSSTVRAPTYSDINLTMENANPVEADGGGIFPDIFLDPTITYRVVYTGANDGITPPVEFWTADPVLEAWPANVSIYWDQPQQFLGGVPPVASEIMGIYTAVRRQKIFANFDGTTSGFAKAWGSVITPPADADYVVSLFLNNTGSAIGTMTIAKTTGTFSFLTTGGVAITLDAGEFIVWEGAATPDSAVADISWTITGINL